MPPIHFWPLLVAGVVDYLLATMLAIAVIWPFLGNPPGALRHDRWMGLSVVQI